MRNKKAQVGSTLTWIFALLTVLFIMVIFIAGSMTLANVRGARQPGTLFASYTPFSLSEITILNQKIGNFLNSKNNFGNMYSLLSQAELKDKLDERKVVFNNQYKIFSQISLPSNYYLMDFSLQNKTGSSFGWPWIYLPPYIVNFPAYPQEIKLLGLNLQIPIYEGKRLFISVGKTK
jgi:hypothetical protein